MTEFGTPQHFLEIEKLCMDKDAEIDRLQAGLQWYAETFCEGWCKESHSTAAFDDCAGCKARVTLAKTTKEGE